MVLGGALLAVISACRRAAAPPAPSNPAPDPYKPQIDILYASPSREALRTKPLESARAELPAIYRLIPDRRFVFALADLEVLLVRAQKIHLRLVPVDGGWDVIGESGTLGQIPDHATFSEASGVLLRRARQLLSEPGPGPIRSEKPHETAADVASRFDPIDRISFLEASESRWNRNPDPEVRRAAAHAYLELCLQTLDGMEMGDALYGRALALQAMAAVGRMPSPDEQAVLAWLMGYDQEALSLARELRPEDPVRRVLTQNSEVPPGIAKSAPSWVRYMALLRLADARNERGWLEWQSEHFPDMDKSLSLLRASLGLNRMEDQGGWARAVLQAAANGVRRTSVRKAGEGLPDEFERDLERHCAAAGSGLWDAWTCESHWKAAFFAGLDTLGRHYVDTLSSGPGAQEFLKSVVGAPSRRTSAQFARWYGDLTGALVGTPGSEKEFDDLREIPDLGGVAAERLYQLLPDFLHWRPRFGGEAVRRLAMQMDGRPAHRALLLEHVRLPLMDMREVERLCGSPSFQAGPVTGLTFWCARFRENAGYLTAFLRRSDVPVAERANAAYMLSDLETHAVTRARFRALLRESGFARAVTSPYLTYLDLLETDLEEMEWVTRGWLSHHEEEKGTLTQAIYLARLAHTRSLRGHHQEGWKLIEPLLATWQGTIMVWGAKILDRLGRSEEAMELARAIVQRYPGEPDGRGVLAELLWRNGRYSEAALVLDPEQFRLQPRDWTRMGAAFRDAMKDKSDEEVLRALQALRAERIATIYFQDFLEKIGETRPDVVFRACAELKGSGGLELVKARSFAYRYLLRSQGPAAALEWLRESLPAGLREVAAQQFFQDREYGLLWDVVEVPGSELGSLTWLLRAGASLMEPPSAARRDALSARFSQSRPGDMHHLLGRFLLGLEEQVTVERAASAPQDRSDACAALAIRAMAFGRYEEASDWFHLAVLFSERNSELSNLSYAQLGRWYAESKPLSLLAAGRIH